MQAKRVLVGEIGRPHGVRGLVKLRSFTADPTAIAEYGPLTDEGGTKRYDLVLLAEGLARIEGVADREAAQRLTGTKLYVERDRLPPPEEEDEFYLIDLIGLAAVDPAGQPLGTVRDVEEHGAGAFLALRTAGGDLLLPFTRACVPQVDIASGHVVVVLPEEVVVPPQPGEEDAA
jgi:16S rRNA processing protein RimM